LGDLFAIGCVFVLAALAGYALWRGVKGLLSGVAPSPTGMNLAPAARRTEPVAYWAYEAFWLGAGFVLVVAVVRWLLALAGA
jgi:hypothetical protein